MLSFQLYDGLRLAAPHLSARPEQQLPFLHAAAVALYQPLASCAFDAQRRHAPIADALDAALQSQLAQLRAPLRLSRHTHLLCTLQRAFGHLMAEMQQEIGRKQQGQPEPPGAAELTRHLALALRAVAAELLGELRAQHAAGRAWSEAEARDQCEVVPSVLRLLHRTLSDYHAAFADKLSLSVEALRLVVEAYFALLEAAFAFATHAHLPATLYFLTHEEAEAREQDEASALTPRSRAYREGLVDVAALQRGISEMERRAGEGPAAAEELQRLLALTAEEAAARPEAAAVLAEAAKLLLEAEAAWRRPSEPGVARDSSLASLSEGDNQLAEGVEAVTEEAGALRESGTEGTEPAAEPAAEPAKPAVWRQSDALNRAGRTANEEHDPARALRLFEAAYALAPRAPILISAANMRTKTGDYGVALLMYEMVISGELDGAWIEPGGLKASHRSVAERKRAETEELCRGSREALRSMRGELASQEREAAVEAEAVRAAAVRAAAAAAVQAEREAAMARERAVAAAAGRPPAVVPDAEVAAALAEHARDLVLSSARKRWEQRLAEAAEVAAAKATAAARAALARAAGFEGPAPGEPRWQQGSRDEFDAAVARAEQSGEGGEAVGKMSRQSSGGAASADGPGADGLSKEGLEELTNLLVDDAELEHAYFAEALGSYHPDGARPALRLWARGYLRAAAPCLERIRALAEKHRTSNDKMGGLAEWNALWPPLERFNLALQRGGEPPLMLKPPLRSSFAGGFAGSFASGDAASRVGAANAAVADPVAELMSPLVSEYVTNLTTRFDQDLEASWEVPCLLGSLDSLGLLGSRYSRCSLLLTTGRDVAATGRRRLRRGARGGGLGPLPHVRLGDRGLPRTQQAGGAAARRVARAARRATLLHPDQVPSSPYPPYLPLPPLPPLPRLPLLPLLPPSPPLPLSASPHPP